MTGKKGENKHIESEKISKVCKIGEPTTCTQNGEEKSTGCTVATGTRTLIEDEFRSCSFRICEGCKKYGFWTKGPQ